MNPIKSKRYSFRNHLKRNYKHYYAQNSDGVWEEVERSACIQYDPATSFKGKYQQRWFCDFESDYIVRLSRDKPGEQLYQAAMHLRRKDKKLIAEQFGCVGDNCPQCRGWDEIVDGEPKCGRCPNKVVFVTLDSENEYEDAMDGIDLDSCINSARQHERSYLLETLHEVLDGFTNAERKLWKCLAADMKKSDIALLFGWTDDKLRHKQENLYEKLRSNEQLKKYF